MFIILVLSTTCGCGSSLCCTIVGVAATCNCGCVTVTVGMLPVSTRRLVKDEAVASYEYREVALQAPQGDELLVKVAKVALCGTDINLYHWNNSRRGIIRPYALTVLLNLI